MSTQAPAITQPNSTQLAALEPKFSQLDTFAKQHNLESLIAESGAFTAQLKLASAMVQLREMLTAEVMEPIMALQGSALGFRTDKDAEGGYKQDVVKEVLIEATMKGFRLFANETNIIGARFYATREGFERIFRDLAKSGRVTNLRLSPGVPKSVGDGAIVDYAATWTLKNAAGDAINDELKLSIPIRVNKGQSADAILGKAKRKMLAAIYSRITGTEITDGEVEDAKTIDITAQKPGEPQPKAKLDDAVLADLEKLLKPHEEPANKYLRGIQWIGEQETFRDLPDKYAKQILAKKDGFLTAAGIKA
jgi:hypothetical protein